MTQFLFRILKEGSETCPTCPRKVEEAQHVVFECRKFGKRREDLKKACNSGKHDAQ